MTEQVKAKTIRFRLFVDAHSEGPQAEFWEPIFTVNGGDLDKVLSDMAHQVVARRNAANERHQEIMGHLQEISGQIGAARSRLLGGGKETGGRGQEAGGRGQEAVRKRGRREPLAA